MNRLISFLCLSLALLTMACGSASNNAASDSGNVASGHSKISNRKYADYFASLDKCWHIGSDVKVINFSGDTLSLTEGSFHDAGPTNGYVYVRDNKFCYMGMGGGFFDGFKPDDDWVPGEEFDIPEDQLTTFQVVKHDGYSELLIDGEFSGYDSLIIDHSYFVGYYKGKRTGKSYYIDIDNKNCQGFGNPSFSVFYSDDFSEDEYGDNFGDILAVFGDRLYFNPRNLSFHKGEELVDVLQRVYPTDKERYPFTATRELTSEALQNFSLDDLKIMRNEIFARHGFIFSTDAMKAHFGAQSWYKPTKTNVDSDLSSIENKNVAKIKEVEDKMKSSNK